MTLETEVRQTIRWVRRAFDRLAIDWGWKPGEYRVYVRINPDWGLVHVILVAKAFPGHTEREQWQNVKDYVAENFGEEEPWLVRSLSLTLRTFDQIEEGGIYHINPQFLDVHEEFVGGSATGFDTAFQD